MFQAKFRLRLRPAAFSVAVGLTSLITSTAAPAVVRQLTTPFIRATGPLKHMRLDPKGRYVAYTGDGGLALSLLDLKTKNIYSISAGQVGGSFFWAPDGVRLIYREETAAADGSVKSVVRAYDCALAHSVTLDEMPFASGLLTFDPRDLRLQLLTPKGIRTKRMYFPGERLARWQVGQRSEEGKWLATQKGLLWVTQGGLAMRQLADDNSGLESFDIAPAGDWIAWATKAGHVYLSHNGKEPKLIGSGRDPRWHPTKPLLVYAGARMVGDQIIGYDLRLADETGAGQFLTATQYSDERWPQWHPRGDQILYTVAKTTDLYLLDFQP